MTSASPERRQPTDASNATSPARRSTKARSRRNRVYASPEKMRAAYLAGQGKNATEIAALLGNTTERKVRDMLRDAGIRMERPFGRPKAVQIHCTNTDLLRLEEAAAEREAAPGDFVLHLLRLLLDEPVLLSNLLDEAEAIA